jgi:ribosomal protein S18 acetylase RimI-like enzyme
VLEWDSERVLHAVYVRQVVAERSGDVVFLLAFANGKPVGRLGIDFGRRADEGIVHLWAFAVLPALQGLGIGTALMREAERLILAEPRGASVVEVGVDEWNQNARRLYERLGYRSMGAERGWSGAAIVLFRRPVSELSASTEPGP